ncbi:hypothetical protein Acsp03_62810 [Actinomadura sp. NBRC 104412]|nr:hypothetical protein Acsp03_62810 [Actinomadura sp. NBRC 104412]
MVLALALLVIGGLALVNALTSSSSEPGSANPPGTQDASESASPTPEQTRATRTAAAAATPLLIRVIGAPTQVFVRVSGSGEVLQQGTLNTGEARQYEQAPLDVVALNGAAVEVVIYGKKQPPKPSGTRGEWFVPER